MSGSVSGLNAAGVYVTASGGGDSVQLQVSFDKLTLQNNKLESEGAWGPS
jgi:hypothetical protein